MPLNPHCQGGKSTIKLAIIVGLIPIDTPWEASNAPVYDLERDSPVPTGHGWKKGLEICYKVCSDDLIGFHGNFTLNKRDFMGSNGGFHP